MKQVNPPDRPPRGVAGSGIRAELRATLALAVPLSAANIAMIAMAVTNTVMVARLGTMPLAAAGLGGMFSGQRRSGRISWSLIAPASALWCRWV